MSVRAFGDGSIEMTLIGDVLVLCESDLNQVIAKHLKTGTRVRLLARSDQARAAVSHTGEDPALSAVVVRAASLVEQAAAKVSPPAALITVAWRQQWNTACRYLSCLYRGPAVAITAALLAFTCYALVAWGVASPNWAALNWYQWALIVGFHVVALAIHEAAHAGALLRAGGSVAFVRILVPSGALAAIDAHDLYAIKSRTTRAHVVLAGPYFDALIWMALFWCQHAYGHAWVVVFWTHSVFLLASIWPFGHTDAYLLCAALTDTPGFAMVSRDCLQSVLTQRRTRLAAEAAVKGQRLVFAMCAYAALAVLGRFVPRLLFLWFLWTVALKGRL